MLGQSPAAAPAVGSVPEYRPLEKQLPTGGGARVGSCPVAPAMQCSGLCEALAGNGDPAQGLPRVFQSDLVLRNLIWLLGVTGDALSEWMEPSHRKGMELDCLLIEM